MCGIVGYWGYRNPQEVIIQGLEKLEYRGYDSAGISFYSNGQFMRLRAPGKLKNLEAKLKEEKTIFPPGRAASGIGHTRWATHGEPSEANAHPHQAQGVHLIHNGIIENYAVIREDLVKKGIQLSSETDSELVAHLIAEEVKITKDLFLAVQRVLPRLKGAFSIVVVWDQKPDQMVAFKDGPPLVLGIGETQSEVFILSDVQAALSYTSKFIHLEDREIVWTQQNSYQIFNELGVPLTKKPVSLNWEAHSAEKRGFPHFMLKEIFEQPLSIASALEPHINKKDSIVEINFQSEKINFKELISNLDRVIIVACGTSYYAGLVAKYIIERWARLSVEVDVSSEFRYRYPILTPPSKILVLTISQSGETADTLAALRLAKSQKVPILSLSNRVHSSIDREADFHLYMNAGPEIGVASTKAFVSTLTVLYALSIYLAKNRSEISGWDLTQENEIVEALLSLPSQMEWVLSYNKYFEQAASDLGQYKGFLYLGRGPNYPISMEGALKLKELAYLHAEGYAAGEMKHGPLALIDKDMAIIVLIPEDEYFEKTLSNLQEAKARGGKIIALGPASVQSQLEKLCTRFITIPPAHPLLVPILIVVPLQLMAYHLAHFLGHDVDQPRNLAKSVTVE